ncbi:MAG: tetratricopeptide repeat protein, partial [Myxococcota bacterium]|nr:tetratricopeptide repeat protein [Myxococcota bacterium]
MNESDSMSWSIDPELLAGLRLDEAKRALTEGNLERALLEAEELLGEHPNHTEALYIVGEAALSLRNAALAREAFTQYLALAEPMPLALLGLAIARFELLDFSGSLESLSDALATNPEMAEAWYTRALILERTDQEEASVEAFAQAHALAPEHCPPPPPYPEPDWEQQLSAAHSLLPGE